MQECYYNADGRSRNRASPHEGKTSGAAVPQSRARRTALGRDARCAWPVTRPGCPERRSRQTKERTVKLHVLALISMVAVAGAANASTAPAWTEGKHYSVLTPVAGLTLGPGQSEVTEVFSYGCPACAQFAPFAHKLQQSLPKGTQGSRSCRPRSIRQRTGRCSSGPTSRPRCSASLTSRTTRCSTRSGRAARSRSSIRRPDGSRIRCRRSRPPRVSTTGVPA